MATFRYIRGIMTFPPLLDNEQLLEMFFSQSLDGFFFMMLDEPVEWGDHVDKERVLDYVFAHQRMTKVNSAIVTQFQATTPEELLGMTPAQFFAHDVEYARKRWREFFDLGRLHTETDERRLDGTPMRIEGDYMVIYDERGRIAGHFGIQRDITDRYLAAERIDASRRQLRALAARLQRVREEERTHIAREIHDELGQALTGLKLDVAWMRGRLPREHGLNDHCQSVIKRIDGTIAAVRRIATELRPSVLDQLGLAAAVEWQGQEFAARTGVEVSLEMSADEIPVPDDLGSSAFRILQEALTNVARHAEAKKVIIRLRKIPGFLQLAVWTTVSGFRKRNWRGPTRSAWSGYGNGRWPAAVSWPSWGGRAAARWFCSGPRFEPRKGHDSSCDCRRSPDRSGRAAPDRLRRGRH